MIKFHCKHCHQKIGAPAQHQGRRVACPSCKQPVRVPADSESSVKVASSLPSDEYSDASLLDDIPAPDSANHANYGVAREYKVKKSIFGGRSILYNCPACGQELQNALPAMAGRTDQCPSCHASHIVPLEIKRQPVQRIQPTESKERRSIDANNAQTASRELQTKKWAGRNLFLAVGLIAAVLVVVGGIAFDRYEKSAAQTAPTDTAMALESDEPLVGGTITGECYVIRGDGQATRATGLMLYLLPRRAPLAAVPEKEDLLDAAENLESLTRAKYDELKARPPIDSPIWDTRIELSKRLAELSEDNHEKLQKEYQQPWVDVYAVLNNSVMFLVTSGQFFDSISFSGFERNSDRKSFESLKNGAFYYPIIQSLAIAQAEVDLHGNYSFTDVPPGQYCLTGLYSTHSFAICWIEPVDVDSGGNVSLNLSSNSTPYVQNAR